MKFTGEFKGLDKVIKKFTSLEPTMTPGMVQAVAKATLAVHKSAVKSIKEKSLGYQEWRYKPKRLVVVSKPGDAPNSDTGRLIQSIQFEFENGGLKGLVGTNLKYGAYLELVYDRPWLAPALADVAEDVQDIMQKAINDALYKSLGVNNIVKDLKGIGKAAKRGAKSVSKTFKKATKKKKAKR